MTDAELTAKLYKAGAAPEGVEHCKIDGHGWYTTIGDLGRDWLPVTDIATAVTMADAMLQKKRISYWSINSRVDKKTRAIIRGATVWVAYDWGRQIGRCSQGTCARILAQAILEVLEEEE